MSERQKVEEYLRLYAIEECLDETMNELVEKRPTNPYIAISRMMEIKSLPEIMDVIISPAIVGRGLAGVEVVIMTNIGAFTGTGAFRYDLPEIGPLEFFPDYATIQDTLRSTLSKIDPRNAVDVDKALEAMTNLNSTVTMAVSVACCRAAARHSGLTLYRYLAGRLGEDTLRIPLPVVSILSRCGSTESPLLVSQDISVLPTAMSSIASALEAVQCLHRLIVKGIDAEKIPLTVSDCGSLRVTMPNYEDAFLMY
jgi:L-alanine-DL-glutamate epimerase-like enolase superfamily enzyme